MSDRASNTDQSNLEYLECFLYVCVRILGGLVQNAGLVEDVSKSMNQEEKTWTDGKLMWNVQIPLMRKLGKQTPALPSSTWVLKAFPVWIKNPTS